MAFILGPAAGKLCAQQAAAAATAAGAGKGVLCIQHTSTFEVKNSRTKKGKTEIETAYRAFSLMF